MGSRRILLDCGLAHLAPLEAARDRIETADFLFCSHAHGDHARGILDFHRRFPQVPIFASEATAQLLPLNWIDRNEPISHHLCQALPWHTPIQLTDDLTIQLWPAGHLPGAAGALLTYAAPQRPYSLFYSGDFFISNSRLVDGLPLESLRGLKPDVLIIEGSEGTTRHPHRRQQENQLAATINSLIQEGRSVLLPVPTLGLGQELIMLLRSHHQFTGKDITVWVDPTVALGCDLYLDLLPHLPSSVQNFARHQPLFWDERIFPRIRRLPTEDPFDRPEPCILIGHREADLSRYCLASQHPWTVLLPESFASDLAVTALSAPEAEGSLTLNWLQALAPALESGQLQLETYLLTIHSDRVGTTQLIHNLRPQHVVFIHGQPTQLADLAGLEELQTRYQLHLPSAGKRVDFPIGDRFLQPAAPDPVFEGEITQVDDSVLLLLPETLTADPRWRRLIDTGLIQARWQGEDLLIKGLSQRELLRAVDTEERLGAQANCHHCRHLREGRCRHPGSPLYGMRVSPEGYCTAFEERPDAPSEDEASA
ncbi:MAG TPA: MBL fold metallo-hydrolase [Leptolyngbyaceae cyanobacterium M65_K2018_010]|nr:MBL fold metallo-hydrolase [Leptolyngbyaceae cyanobacterium M65_K2018_010]